MTRAEGEKAAWWRWLGVVLCFVSATVTIASAMLIALMVLT